MLVGTFYNKFNAHLQTESRTRVAEEMQREKSEARHEDKETDGATQDRANGATQDRANNYFIKIY